MARGERGRARVVLLVLAAVVAVAGVVAALVLVGPSGDGEGDPTARAVTAAAERFATAVERGTPEAGGLVDDPSTVATEWDAAVAGLGEAATIAVEPGAAAVDGDEARVPLRATWTVGGARWATDGTLVLAREPDDPAAGGTWLARWALASLDDRLRPHDLLAATPAVVDRAPILDGAGDPLLAPTEVVVIGVEPRRVTDVDALAAELARILGVDGDALAARVAAAPDDQLVEVITLRRPDYDAVRDQVRPLPGTVFREETRTLAPTRSFARAVLGTVAGASAEQAAASEGRLEAGDLTGVGGVQERYDERLRGTPGLVVTVTRGADADGGEAATEELEQVAAVPGEPVRTTLDRATQAAAEAALAGEERVAALVAVRASTGEVLAAAHAPEGTASAVGLTGRVAPGSTFKVVTTLALLGHGLRADDPVACPPTAVVGGREFGNAGGFALVDPTFRDDLAASCNTAFVALSEQLAPDDLATAAASFGLGVPWDAGLPAYVGSVPPTEGATDAAAAAIGQGRIQVSPLGMAMVAATVAAGTWHPPVLVSDPAPPSAPAPADLDPAHAEVLRDLMRAVVTEGTGDVLGDVPGGEVHAKTGTAEYGTEDPPRAHAWIIGFQGDVAFAVFVEGGESGRGTAGPVAARFLTALADG